MNKPTLGYWAIRGLASQIRYLMVYLGVDYQEDIYEQGDGPEFSRASWQDKKNSLGLEFPNLPYFIDGNVKMTETISIMKYICNKHGKELLGRDAAEQGQVEMLQSVIADLKGAVTLPCYTTGDRAAISKLIHEKIGPIVSYLGEKPFLIGENVTYVDFIFFELLDFCGFITEGKVFQQHGPNLKEFMLRMSNLPKLKEFWADPQRCIKRPFNNKIAKLNN